MISYNNEYWNDIHKVVQYIVNQEKLYGKTVLVTGAGGLICSTVCDVIFFLNKRYNAGIKLFLAGRSKERIIKRFFELQDNEDFHYIQYDATKEFNCLEKIDFIIHGASYGDPSGIMNEPVETMLCNFNGLFFLLEHLRKQGNGRLCYISSSEIYGKNESKSLFSESDYGYVDLLSPRSCYPSSKRASETLCSAFNIEYGVDSVIVRPGHIYGPQITNFDSRISAECTRNAKKQLPLELRSSGNQLRSYTYSLDCASAILSILLCGEKCTAYNISNKNSVCTIKQFAEYMAKTANVFLNIKSDESNQSKNWNKMKNSVLDSSALEKLGWRGVFPIDIGIERTLRFFEVEK